MQKGGKNTVLRVAAAAFAAGLLTFALSAPASGQGLIEVFFNGLSRALQAPVPAAPPPESVRAYAEPLGRFVRAINPPSVHVESGPAAAFCVRTCDGHYFPVQAHAGMSAAEACHAFCPASSTRVYAGSDIDYAVAHDGSRYADLDAAYTYRKHLVAGCTCNGHDQFGLAHIDPATDPTLRPGDVVATRRGLMAFTGRNKRTADFTPAETYSHFPKSYRDKLSKIDLMPPTPGESAAVKFAPGHDRNARR
jgi:Protein of unknown function (DUF2865)